MEEVGLQETRGWRVLEVWCSTSSASSAKGVMGIEGQVASREKPGQVAPDRLKGRRELPWGGWLAPLGMLFSPYKAADLDYGRWEMPRPSYVGSWYCDYGRPQRQLTPELPNRSAASPAGQSTASSAGSPNCTMAGQMVRREEAPPFPGFLLPRLPAHSTTYSPHPDSCQGFLLPPQHTHSLLHPGSYSTTYSYPGSYSLHTLVPYPYHTITRRSSSILAKPLP